MLLNEPPFVAVPSFSESHFTALRKFALDNTDHRSHEEQQEAIKSYLSWRNRTRDISLEDWKSYRRAQKKVA